MATQVLGTIGSVVGTAVGGSVGGFIGGQIGSALGSAISGTQKKTYDGARLEDLAVQTSTYGKAIPKLWGSVRLAGNVVWSLPIKEMVTTTTVSGGGKGGSTGAKSKTTENDYSYYITLAIAICEGEITSIDRVWADAELLDLSQGTYRIYTGGETQMPDPLIESYEGVGTTPAYRGMAYVVIEDFPMGDFGNRIPNFSFEITRRTPQADTDNVSVESMVTSVMLIPGSGEFVYDTVSDYKAGGTDVSGNWVPVGFNTPLNQHTPDGKANVLVALDQMQETFPNLEWVGLAVNWFGTATDIGTCEVWPCVEYQADSQTSPETWNVAGLTRTTARQIGNDSGNLRYGGTPDDGSIVRLCAELRSRGLKVFFYPMMLMDVAGKPWRGTLTGSASNVTNFFTKTRGYNNFILHYANLVAGKVDAFAIGSELKALTSITTGGGVFPAVTQLVSLAAAVQAILNPHPTKTVAVTYAADWSEYHHEDSAGWHHLDPLWSSSNIDVVGIDAYFPLSDAPQGDYDVDALKAGWTSGEGYDWYYSDTARTTKVNLSPQYAWKNINYWWTHTHTNPDGSATAWVPESKPVWFTEYGYASVDGCANEPNVFIDATTTGSGYPRFSQGRVDFMAQRTAIAATESQWAANDVVARRFLWTWDARPYPYWPDLLEVWADGGDWVTGHWVQGKLGTSHVAPAVEELAATAGVDLSLVDTSQLQLGMDGFVLASRTTARAVLEQLMQAFFFSFRESGGKLVALPRQADSVMSITPADCLPMTDAERQVAYQLQRSEDMVLPDVVEVHSLNRLDLYATQVQSAQRGTQNANDVDAVQLALVMSEAHGRALAENLLADSWAQRSTVTLQLPMRFAVLETGDVISLVDGEVTHRLRLQQVQIGKPGMVKLTATIDVSDVWDGYIEPTLGSDGSSLMPPATTMMQVLDVPAFPGDAADALTMRFAVCGNGAGWAGATILKVNDSGDDSILAQTATAATMGSCTTVLPAEPSQRIDHASVLEVNLLGNGTLSSVTLEAMLDGANVALVGNEIIQFANATLVSPGKYQLSTLLRGLQGTEYAIGSHVAGERFVLLDAAILAVTLPTTALGQSWTFRAVTAGSALGAGTEVSGLITGECLRPFSPVEVKATRDGSNNVTFNWIRRTRVDGSLNDYVDVPLREQSEVYDVAILSGGVAVRSWQVTSPTVAYSAANQMTDFGSYLSSYTVQIDQRSAVVGPGHVFSGSVTIS